jgi:hypothetical protein
VDRRLDDGVTLDSVALSDTGSSAPGSAPAAVTAGDPPLPPRSETDTQPIRFTVGSQIPAPDEDSVTLVRTSFWYLGDVELLSQRFDARLLCLTPHAEEVLRRHFPRGGEWFISALLRPVEALVARRAGLPEADPEEQLRTLGARLYEAGMSGQDFSYIGLALVRAVRDSCSSPWTTALGAAWSEIHNWVVPHLSLGAREAELGETERTLGARAMRLGSLPGDESVAS